MINCFKKNNNGVGVGIGGVREHVETFIQSDPEALQADAHSPLFLVGTAPDTPNNIKLEELCQNKRTPIITIAPVTGKIKLYYGFTNLGGTRTRAQNKIVALEGIGASATPLFFPEDGLLNNCSVRIPLVSDLASALDSETFRQISPESGARRTTFKNSGYIMLPPFLAQVILESTERDPAHLAITLRDTRKEFDDKHKEDHTIDSPLPLLDSILPFLWGAANSKIEAIPRIADLDDPELQNWGNEMHAQFITPVTHSPSANQLPQSDTALVLASNIENQTSVMERILQKRDSEKENKKSKFENLPESSQNLIKNASSPDAEFVPQTPLENCVEFFKKKDAARARDYLEEVLELKFGCVVSVDRGAALALYAGAFVRDLDDLPSNFSFFLVPKKKPSASRTKNKSMMLQLKVLNGQGWSEKDFKEAAKQGVEAPSSIEELRFQLENLAGLSAFFFGETAILTRNLVDLSHKIKSRIVAFDAQQESDFEFASKIGYAIDTRVFRWLQQCRDMEERRSR